MNKQELFTKIEPLTQQELLFLEDTLKKYSTETFALDTSGLDGFVTAMILGAEHKDIDTCLLTLWDGTMPDWESEAEMDKFYDLMFQQTGNNIANLVKEPETYTPSFLVKTTIEEKVIVVNNWCKGFVRAIPLGDWSSLPENLYDSLHIIMAYESATFQEILDKIITEEYLKPTNIIKRCIIQLMVFRVSQQVMQQEELHQIVESDNNDL